MANGDIFEIIYKNGEKIEVKPLPKWLILLK
jgi:hypothetical protein